MPTTLSRQLFELFILAIPIACIAWTVTHEEIFREQRDFCQEKSKSCGYLYARKFFYVFTCEYCFSHYVVLFFLVLTRYKLLFPDWRGYLVSGFSLVWIANLYMSSFGRLRLGIKAEGAEVSAIQRKIEQHSDEPDIAPLHDRDRIH